MGMEEALLARAGTHVVQAKAKTIVHAEMVKGCCPAISPRPVELEPAYQPIPSAEQVVRGQVTDAAVPLRRVPDDQWLRLLVWLSPQQSCDWLRAELLLKQLSCAEHRMALEILGNRERVAIQFFCHQTDLPVLRSAFLGQFERCTLSLARTSGLGVGAAATWDDAVFVDFHPLPPYSHLLTGPDELKRSPYSTLITALASVPAPALGLYQVVFAPVSPDHNWHQNVQALLDLEYAVKLMGGPTSVQRHAQQTPSGDLRQMAMDVEIKAHNDKPFFAAALRIGLIGAVDDAPGLLRSLAVFAGMIQHGGRPLALLGKEEYRHFLCTEDIRRMFVFGQAHRPGFLVNSRELASLVHLPPSEITEAAATVLAPLETLPPSESLATGTPIGTTIWTDAHLPVCIPPALRRRHTHLIGKPGMGKSTLMESMFLDDLRQGHGAALLDPHGQLAQRLLCLIPPEHADRVIYLDPGDPDWVPIWNPLHSAAGAGADRVADDLVRAFKSIVDGWGDRLEHLLRHAVMALLRLPGSSLMDVSNLLRQRSDESRQLRSLLLQVLENPLALSFWRQDFDRYSAADLSPPQHKLSKLLTSGSVSLMLAQSDSAFDLRAVIEEGKVLLVDLSTLGPEVREILGCFLLSLLHLTALGRGGEPGQELRPFHIYCDEAHRFMTDAMEDLIAETRKFNVSLALAHQYLSQFSRPKVDALANVGSTVIFNVDTRDAQHLKKDLQGLVEIDDLITLEVGQAIARIGTEVVRLRAHPPLPIPPDNGRQRIIEQCRRLYCKPTREVLRAVRRRADLWAHPPADGDPDGTDMGGAKTTRRGKRKSSAPLSPVDWEAFEKEVRNHDTF